MSSHGHHGQKVTTDSRSKIEVGEAVGVVTSDSLAAESKSFGEGNAKAVISKQPSKSTNTNNTDISNATRLEPAPDAEAREAQEGWSETSQLNAGQGLGKESGVGPTYATGGGSGSTGGVLDPLADHAQGGITGGYAGAGDSARDPGEFRPKGKNITEGGFDDSAPNASFNQAIGTKKDPGLVAEAKFERDNAYSGADGISKQAGFTGDSPYDALKREEAS
ncbi:hypothetical protein BCR34DRAFT_232504 [Clohesyomyces aquaticus]|uniref:Uncharacterized protein n=1 Tax=Clohesyomyces aquaticus TaxID=1231657 RepID=A0A1Y1ZW03_9PLEO|nr:hypothetical protein BCR34DRAFT_232504 [Clohesyomyces aquaticus]